MKEGRAEPSVRPSVRVGGQKVAKIVLRWTDATGADGRKFRTLDASTSSSSTAVIKISPMQGRKARLTMGAVKRPFPRLTNPFPFRPLTKRGRREEIAIPPA